MILSLLSLGVEQTIQIKEAQNAIERAFKNVLDADYSFRNFGTEKSFLEELSKSVASDNIIVVGAEPKLYTAFKSFVCKSFQLKLKPNKTLIKMITEAHPELTEDVVNEQSLIPPNSVPLISQDGIYSGFGVKAKKQLLIVLPLDDKRIDYIINRGLYSYVRANMDMSVLSSDPLKNVETQPKSVLKRNNNSTEPLYNIQVVKDTLAKLSEKGLTVAVANTKMVDFLGKISTTQVDLSKTFFVSSYNCEKGNMSAREYVIDLAKGALKSSVNSVGAAITKVFSVTNEMTGEPQFFMYICIADQETANVAKFVAEPGETPPQLIYKAIEELFKMLDLWSETGYAMPQFTDESIIRDTIQNDEVDSKLRKIKYAVSGMIAASFLLSLAVSLLAQDVYGVL